MSDTLHIVPLGSHVRECANCGTLVAISIRITACPVCAIAARLGAAP